MKYPFKKGISDNNSFLKRSRKITSILVVFLLLSTLLSTVVSSERISSFTQSLINRNIYISLNFIYNIK